MENTTATLLDEGPSSLDGECPSEVDSSLWEQWRNWQKEPADSFLVQYKKGLEGFNEGIGNGLITINKYLYGTHRARYYLIGADSGVGKTTISDFMFVLKAWEDCQKRGKKFRGFYCSFEISKANKISRWVSYFIFVKWGIRLPSDYILGRIHGMTVSKEHNEMVLVAYAQVRKMMKDIVFIDHMMSPTQVFEKIIRVHYDRIGVVSRLFVSEDEKKKGKLGAITGYKVNMEHEDTFTLLIVDHAALHDGEYGLDLKGTMDRASKYYVILRNLFGTTIVNIQQFSTDMLSANRDNFGKKNEKNIAPSRLDFGDSKATFRDADVVMGAVKPIQHLSEFMGYKLSKLDGLGDCFIALYLMKNRYGASSKILPVFLDGVTGYVYDLPPEPSNDFVMQSWYQKTAEIDKLCQTFCQQDL
jgi:hypothetical protein